MKDTKQTFTPRISIAVRAWNEDAAIRATLDSLFQQSLFEALISLATSDVARTIVGQITGQA